jgi:hypothetical protein
MKFLCLAYEEQAVLDRLTKEQWQTLRRETLDYVEGLRTSGQLLEARPLQSAATAATVRVRNGRSSITDGPFAETKEQLGGYFLIEAADRDEALRIAAAWPSARFGSIEVRPIEEALREDGRYTPSQI